MICYSTIRAAVTSVVVFALITTTIGCSGEGDSRQKDQSDLMAGVRGGQPIYIRDPQLLSLVRQAVGTGAEFVTDKQMAMVQEIIAAPHFTLESRVEPNPIRDLEGLEFATDLTHLDLSGHHLIDDITLFNFDSYDYSPLDTLETLDIEIIYAIYAIYAIYHMNLVQFTATISDVDDLTPLAGLKNLKHLYLGDCGIRDWDENAIAPLAGLTNLETLHLNHNTIYAVGRINQSEIPRLKPVRDRRHHAIGGLDQLRIPISKRECCF